METKYLTMAIRTLRYFDDEHAPDWADAAEAELASITADLSRLAAENAELKAALKPLAEIPCKGTWKDHERLTSDVNVGDIRRAAALLKDAQK